MCRRWFVKILVFVEIAHWPISIGLPLTIKNFTVFTTTLPFADSVVSVKEKLFPSALNARFDIWSFDVATTVPFSITETV